eukprot:4781688-Alexandrium_andersonii.AAC.1
MQPTEARVQRCTAFHAQSPSVTHRATDVDAAIRPAHSTDTHENNFVRPTASRTRPEACAKTQ